MSHMIWRETSNRTRHPSHIDSQTRMDAFDGNLLDNFIQLTKNWIKKEKTIVSQKFQH